jgi:DNA replication initiation complex subunit (GINS family)
MWRRERKSSDLIPLEENFFEKIQMYLKHLETLSTDDADDLVRKLFFKRYQRVSYVVNDLIAIRLEKHFRGALNGEQIPENIPLEERETRSKLSKLLKDHNNKVLGIKYKDKNVSDHHSNISGEPIQSFDKDDLDVNDDLANLGENGYQYVYFIENEPEESLGADLKTYGPFFKGSYALLPVENVKELLKRNKIEIIERETEEL